MQSKDGTYYFSLRDSLQSLDLVAFRGGDFVSDAIARISQSTLGSKEAGNFTHVGVVVRGDAFPEGHPYRHPRQVYILESTQSGSIGDKVYNIDGRAKLGCQLRVLDEVMRLYDLAEFTKVYFSRPIHSFDSTRVFEIVSQYFHVTYNFNCLDLLAAAYPRLRCLRGIFSFFTKAPCAGCAVSNDEKSKELMFCSELVACIYKDAGILDASVNPQNVLPADFFCKDRDGEVDCGLFSRPTLVTYYPKKVVKTIDEDPKVSNEEEEVTVGVSV